MDEPKPKKKYFTLPNATLGLGLSTLSGWGLFDPDTFKAFISAAWKEELVKMLLAFTMAGVVHRFIFRKDMEKYFMKIVTPIVDALNKIADKSDQIDGKLTEANARLEGHDKRLLLVEQHLTPRENQV